MRFQIGDRVEMRAEFRDWGRTEPRPRMVGTVIGGLPADKLYTWHVFDASHGVQDFATVWVAWDDPAIGESSCTPGLLERLPIEHGAAV